jgi:hypothetical protein
LDLEANWQVIEKQTKNNLENGEEYVGLTETPYQNLMLDIWVMKTKERLAGHMSFLPQEVVWHEIWIGGL